MAIEIHGTMKPKNGGAFPIVEAADVLMPDGSRLSQFQGGGVSSWNDLTDKPFYAESWSGTLDTTNGFPDPAGELNGTVYYRIAEVTLTQEQFLDATLEVTADGVTTSGTMRDFGMTFSSIGEGAYIHEESGMILVTQMAEFTSDGVVVATIQPGVFMVAEAIREGIKITLSGEKIQELDGKYIKTAVAEYVESYINEALGGDY